MTQTWVSSFHRAGSINTPLAFGTISPLTAAIQNVLYNFQILGTGGFPPYAVQLTGQTGGNGWSIPQPLNGIITGTPSLVETDALTVKLTDSQGTSITGIFQLPVNPQPQAAAPTFNPPAGTYAATQFVAISSTTPGSIGWYTNDGSTPVVIGGVPQGTTTQYTTSVIVNASETLRAIATATGFANSNVTTAAYTIGGAGQTFDFYIGPRAGIDTNPQGVAAGADTNLGTLASPWAISSLTLYILNANNNANCRATAGKRIGFLPGTYDVSGIALALGATNLTAASGVLKLIGGSSSNSTVWASSDATGHQSPRTATLDMKGASGQFGAGISETMLVDHNGSWPSLNGSGGGPGSWPVGWAILDGLRFTGYQWKGVRLGGLSSNDGIAITGTVIVQNCEFFGQGGTGGDNHASLWIDGFQPPGTQQGCLTTNNWFHDNIGHNGPTDTDHINGIIVWGFNKLCWGVEISFNTLVNSSNIYGKEGGVSGCNIHHNYVDVSTYTAGSVAIEDFMSGGQATIVTHPSTINNNVLLVRNGSSAGPNWGIGGPTQGQTGTGYTYAWQTPVDIHNNTIVVTPSGGSGPVIAFTEVASDGTGVNNAKYYNNIYVSSTTGSWNSMGNFYVNSNGPTVWDYNLYPSSGVNWQLYQNGPSFSSALQTHIGAPATTPAAFATLLSSNGGISNADAHSLTGVPTFTNTGLYAAKYQLQPGSLGQGTGYTNGTGSGGSPTDMGAWGNGATSVGCNFAV